MNENRILNGEQRLTRKQREASDKKWYRDQIDSLDKISFSNNFFTTLGDISEYRKMKINYDLFNNKVDKTDFEHVCKPFGEGVGELPAEFTNKDILSGKIKALIGMEMRRPFSWKVIAVNEEATTRREQEEAQMLKDWVSKELLLPMRQEIERQKQEELQGRKLTPEEAEQLNQQIDAELQTKTPEEIKRYMEREHQDPAEILSHQILEYLMEKQDIKVKFNEGWKHGLISGKEIFWVGELNGEPYLKNINPLRFDCDISPDNSFIEDGEWACYQMYMLPSEIVKYFGNELNEKQIDDIYELYSKSGDALEQFDFSSNTIDNRGIKVLHCEWKSLKALKFVTSQDFETGEINEDIVDETYVMNREAGDISVRTEWIPTKFEGYKIGKDIYVNMREVPGQSKDLTNLYNCKLSYIGAYYDNLNSQTTSLVDRMKYYQYLYNIIWYKLELLISSDEGKSLFLGANIIPKDMKLEQWLHYWKINKIGIVDPTEEGKKTGSEVSQAVKEVNMSLASDIEKYMKILEYLERRCGESVGITKQVEGQIGSSELVRNTQQALIQSANILEPYFDIHNSIKKNVLQALIETAKATYVVTQPAYLNYMLDDMSRKMISMEYDLLDNSTYAIFVSNSAKSAEALETVKQLSHAAMQNQMIELSDVLTVMNATSSKEAEEMLKVAEKQRQEAMAQQQQQQIQAKAEAEEKAREFKREEWEFQIKFLERQEELKTERELQKQAMLSIGFNEDKDLDKDGIPDILEIYKAGNEANIKQQMIDLQEAKLEEQKKQHEDKMKLEEKKLKHSQLLKSKITAR